MKTIFTKVLLLVVVASAYTLSASAQAYLEDPKYGSSPDERQENVLKLNYFNDAYSNKNYNGAVPYLQALLVSAPKCSQNLYINGINIYRNKIARATSKADQKVYLDSLMLLYDLRMENFGNHASRGKNYIIGLKVRDYVANNPADRAGLQKLFGDALALNGNEIDPELVTIYFNSLVDGYKADEVGTDLLLSEYDKLATILTLNPTPEKADAKKTFDALFVSSGAASCENLEKVFAPSVAASPSDVALLEKVFALLYSNNCSSPFQVSVAEKLYVVKPSSAIALSLAATFEANKNYEKARQYLNEAIAKESDPTMKANLAVRIAGGELQQNNARAAAEYAKQAIEIDPKSGFAYVILAQAYVSGSAACSGFDRQSAFWLVVDTLTKARELVTDAAQLSSIESQLNAYRGQFPSNEECFFRGLENGSGYNVSCGWISGRTVVRAR